MYFLKSILTPLQCTPPPPPPTPMKGSSAGTMSSPPFLVWCSNVSVYHCVSIFPSLCHIFLAQLKTLYFLFRTLSSKYLGRAWVPILPFKISGIFFSYSLDSAFDAGLGFLLLWWNTTMKIQVGEERVYLACASPALFITEGSQDRNSKEGRSQKQELTQGLWSSAAYWLVPHGLVSYRKPRTTR